jgi:iron(II)-dependent oxidoreductase
MKKKLLLFLSLIAIACLSFGQETKEGMVLIPGGEYMIGKDVEGGSSTSPAHKVKLSPFYIDKYEVTNKEYKKFCDETGHRLPEFWNTATFRSGENFPNYPVVGITHWDAMKYAEWAGKRLPTEAEWECAARGGLLEMNYPNGDEWAREKAEQEEGNWFNLIHPVGTYAPNGYGLYDMAGNVWEWVYDSYSADYYSNSEYENPKGPEIGGNKVIRGGSWHSGPGCKRVYYRKGLISGWNDFAVGFRCVKDVE